MPSKEILEEILSSAMYAPFGWATGIPLNEMRKIFVFTQWSESMNEAKELLLASIRKNSKMLTTVIKIFPFLKTKMQWFANRLAIISKNRIPWLDQAPYYVIIAEKKWFPPVEKSSIAHVMQNMWLTATDLWLGFQLVSATSLMGNNAKFVTLLWLEKWAFQIDGCVIWYPAKKIDLVKTFDLKNFVTRIK